MARVLIADPDHETRELLERFVSRLGLEPVCANGGSHEEYATVDAAVVEPADETSLALARSLRTLRPDLPIVFASIAPPSVPARALAPQAYLLKPFRLAVLADALNPLSGWPGTRT